MRRKSADQAATRDTPTSPADRAAARERLMAYLAWGVAEGAIIQDQAGEELARFDAAMGAKADPHDV